MRQIGQAKTMQKKPQRRTPEEDFQRRVVQHLRLALPGAVVAHAANERTASEELGRVRGYPDLMVHYRGTTTGLELKAKGRKRKPEQIECAKRLGMQGVSVWVVEDDGDPKVLARLAEGLRLVVECGVEG